MTPINKKKPTCYFFKKKEKRKKEGEAQFLSKLLKSGASLVGVVVKDIELDARKLKRYKILKAVGCFGPILGKRQGKKTTSQNVTRKLQGPLPVFSRMKA